MSRSSGAEPPRDLRVIGVGHRLRQDDAVGPFVAEALAARGLDAVAHEGDGLALLELWSGHTHCILVDAMAGDLPAGEVRRFDGGSQALRAAPFVHSSHRIGVAEAVALGRQLDRLPARLEVIGIAGRRFGFGEDLSPEVRRAAQGVIEELAEGAQVGGFSSATHSRERS